MSSVESVPAGAGSRGSLGRLAIAWIRHFGAGLVGDRLTTLQKTVIVDAYALRDDPRNHHRSYEFVIFQGDLAGRSSLDVAAAIALFEAFGPARYFGRVAQGHEVYTDPWRLGFQYLYQPGEPMGWPVKAPFVHCLAEERSANWERMMDVVFAGWSLLAKVPGLGHEPGRLLLPDGGQIRHTTAADAHLDGGRETFAVFEGLDDVASKRLLRGFRTVKRNMAASRQRSGSWHLQVGLVDPGGEPPGSGHFPVTARST